MSTNNSKRRLPEWYWVIGKYVAGVCCLFVLAYNLGYEVAYRQHRLSFDREFDHAMFRVNDTLAFSLHDDYISLVNYKPGMFPFRPLCGKYEVDGNVLNGVRFKTGDWLYSDYAFRGRPFAFNLRTGKVASSDALFAEQDDSDSKAPSILDGDTMDLEMLRQLDAAREAGWTFADEDRLSVEAVSGDYEALWTINESGTVLVAGCGLVMLGYAAMGLVLRLRP